MGEVELARMKIGTPKETTPEQEWEEIYRFMRLEDPLDPNFIREMLKVWKEIDG